MNEKKYYLDFGPELIKLLGPNLYTNIYYVLGEIIANAYDADANNVYIIYNNDEKRIIVEDDGGGMTYDDFNEKYLRIGTPTRDSEIGDCSPKYHRKRMGRKGIGKLSALSVSDEVMVMSTKDGNKSGCILSVNAHKELNNKWSIPAIPDDQIEFKHISEGGSGSSIVMKNVKYSINKTIESAKRNVSRLFPFISDDFRIHLEDECSKKTAIIENNASEIVKLSDTLITFANEDKPDKLDDKLMDLHKLFNNDRYYKELEKDGNSGEFPGKKQFHRKEDAIIEEITVDTESGKKTYQLIIKGWVSTYATLPDKKSESDFPISYISLISHGKLGRVDIIPEITLNRTFESYVVGQFFVDLLEESELPDIAASNRQGYKEDDLRYIKTLELIREKALRPITNLKDSATDVKNSEAKRKKAAKQKEEKEKMDRVISDIINDPIIVHATQKEPESNESVIKLKKKLEDAFEMKNIVNESYKKIMISHSSKDTEIVDIFEKILLYCGFTSDEIIYTSSQHVESRAEPYGDLYEFLREFFVNTLKRNNLCVVYIVGSDFNKKWNTVLEAGAGWVIKTDSYPMFIKKHADVKTPLDNQSMIPQIAISMGLIEVQNLALAVQKICAKCGKNEPDRDELIEFIKTTKLYKSI